MGKAANMLKEKLGKDNGLAKAAGVAADVYGNLSGAYAAYSAGKSVLTSFGFLDAPANPLDEMARLLDEINGKLNEVLSGIDEVKAKVAGGSTLMTLQLNADEVSLARTAFTNAIAFISSPDSESIKTTFYDSVNDSLKAANLLCGGDTQWMRLYAKEAVYSDDWSTDLDPEHSGDYVWDWRVALVACLEILAWHSTVFLATDEDYKKAHLGLDMQRFAKFLFGVYNRILQNFEAIKPPSIEQLQCVIPLMDDAAFQSSDKGHSYSFDPNIIDWLLKERIPGGNWRRSKYVYGVVEKYSGYSCIATYPSYGLRMGGQFLSPKPFAFYFPRGVAAHEPDDWWKTWADSWWQWWRRMLAVAEPEFQKFYDRFVMNHTLRTWRQARRLYVELGLSKLRETIFQMYEMFGLPAPKELRDYTAWSVREVYSIIPPSIKGTPAPNEPISLHKMAIMLAPGLEIFPSTISLRRIFLLDENIVPA